MQFLAFKIRELLRGTSRSSVRHRKGCWPKKFRFNKSLDKENPANNSVSWLFRVTCEKSDSKSDGHLVKISVKPPVETPNVVTDDFIYDMDVKVSCGCKAFLYYGAQYNSISKDYFDPLWFQKNKRVVPPQIKKRRNLVCKHLYVCLPFAVKFIRNYLVESKMGVS